jgi:hypothetical protein
MLIPSIGYEVVIAMRTTQMIAVNNAPILVLSHQMATD